MLEICLSADRANLVFRFEYSAELVRQVKLIPGRRWQPSERCWVAPFTREIVRELDQFFGVGSYALDPEVRELAEQQRRTQDATVEAKTVQEIPDASKMAYRTTPMKHQEVALNLVIKNASFGVFMDPGTGKTKVMLDAMWYWKRFDDLNPNHPALILTPATVVENWLNEGKIHRPELKIMPLMGSVKNRYGELCRGRQGANYDAYVLNYQIVWRKEILDFLVKWPWFTLIADESRNLVHRTSKQSKAVLGLAKHVGRRYALTGTPGGPLELYNQLRFLDPRLVGNSYYGYRDRYLVMGGYQGYQVVGYRNLEELNQKVNGVSIRVMKSQCLDLPEKVYTIRRIELGVNQQRVYDEMVKHMVAEIKEGTEIMVTNMLAKLTRLRQITAGFVPLADGSVEYFDTNPKFNEWLTIMESHGTEKHVVFTEFIHEHEKFKQFLTVNNIKFVSLDGRTPIEERGKLIEHFQKDEATRVFVANTVAGGIGITLTAASVCTFLSNGYKMDVRSQAEDRLHRKGQKNLVTYYDMVAAGTLDAGILRALRKKQKLEDMLTATNFENVAKGV